VQQFLETFEYREDGKPNHFHSKGNITWLKDAKIDGKDSLIQIDYIYRDDGTLFYQSYYHNGYVFGSTFSTQNKFFDYVGRIYSTLNTISINIKKFSVDFCTLKC